VIAVLAVVVWRSEARKHEVLGEDPKRT